MVNKIEVTYAASAQQQSLVSLTVSENCTVAEAIQHSGILQQFPEINLEINKVGVFGKIVSLASVVQAGDRVEIYRPLMLDPKQTRVQRAQRQKKSRQRLNQRR